MTVENHRPTEPVHLHDRIDRVTFRPLTLDDIPQLVAWLSDPDVARWYEEGELNIENITRHYRPCIEGAEPTRCFIHRFDGIDTGLVQGYLVEDHPDYARQMTLPTGTGASDLFIGHPDFRGQGWGVPLIQAFYRHYIFGVLGASSAIIAPEPANERAIHVYAAAGFEWLKTVPIVDEEEPHNTGDEYIMLMRDEIARALGVPS